MDLVAMDSAMGLSSRMTCTSRISLPLSSFARKESVGVSWSTSSTHTAHCLETAAGQPFSAHAMNFSRAAVSLPSSRSF